MPFFTPGGRDISILWSGEIATWEDVCGGEGRGGTDSVEEEDFVLRGDEEDSGAVSWFWRWGRGGDERGGGTRFCGLFCGFGAGGHVLFL
jgi:hypothetical protein